MAGDNSPLRIAVVGAGLVGAATTLALVKLPNVQISVYEKAPGPQETGAWIAMNVSGLCVLSQLLPDYSELLRIMFQGREGIAHRHWQTGEAMAVSKSPFVAEPFREGRTHRIPLHNLLLSHIPAGTVQYNKEAVSVRVVHPMPENGSDHGAGTTHKVSRKDQRNGRPVGQLRFADGTETEADLIVAADGIYSKLRRSYLPDSIPTYRGSVAYRQVFPEALVQHIKGLPAGTGSWQKSGQICFLSPVGLGKYGFVGIVPEDADYAARLRWGHALGKAGIDRLRKHYANWDPVVRHVIDVLPGIDGYRLESAPWMEDMTRDGVIAFVGDAAHPTAGAYGAGATFGDCDGWALYRSLLSSTPTARSSRLSRSPPRPPHSNESESALLPDIARALKLFNYIRRPFLARVEKQMVIDRKNAAYIAEGAALGGEAEYVRRWTERFSLNWWMLEHNIEAEFQRHDSEARYDLPVRQRDIEELEEASGQAEDARQGG